jgi:hypothetical protein
MRAGAATVVDLAAYLGVTPARVRQIVAKHGIEPVGMRWKAKLYPPRDVIHAAQSARRNAGRAR